MNLVEQIQQQLSSAVINQLGSMIGASEGTTKTMVNAAVPALLSALSNMASSGAGVQKLLSALGQFSSGSVENLVAKLSEEPDAIQKQGTDLLSSLLGGGTLAGIVNLLSRFAGIAPGGTQKLLSYLAPLILGMIASKFSGKSMNAQGLASLFADQKANITKALPSGLSLSDVPGLSAAETAVRTGARAAESTASSLPGWLLPLLGLAALGLLLWFLLPASTPVPEEQVPEVARVQPPELRPAPAPEAVKIQVPDVSKFSTELTDTFSKLTAALTGVKDAASAEAALPSLKDLDAKLEVAKATTKNLADAGRAAIKELAKSAQGKLKELVEKVLAIPGVGEKIKAVVDTIMAKLGDLATV